MTDGLTSPTVLGAVRAGADGSFVFTCSVWQQPTRLMSSSDGGNRDGVRNVRHQLHIDTAGRARRIH
jgi:hypothetical protein